MVLSPLVLLEHGAKHMDVATRERRTSRRMVSVLATLGLVAGMLLTFAPGAGAGVDKCQAKNLNASAKESPDLAALLATASAGDTIQVKGICVGTLRIDRSLTLVGMATKTVPQPTLDANGSGNRRRQRHPQRPDDHRRNTATTGGGIYNGGTLTLNDASSVSGNTADCCGGGIYNSGGILIMNDASSVSGNTADFGGGIYNGGTLTLNGSASVSGNTADGNGGGILNCGGSVSGATDGVNVYNNTPNNSADFC